MARNACDQFAHLPYLSTANLLAAADYAQGTDPAELAAIDQELVRRGMDHLVPAE